MGLLPMMAGVWNAAYLDMPVSLRVQFRDMPASPYVESVVRDWVDKLEHIYERIEYCDVVIERPHQHHRHGQRLRVRVRVGVPGPDLVASHTHELDGAHEDVYVAIRDAFSAVRRQLEDHVRRLRRDVKARIEPQHGRVSYLDVQREWGYIDADDRRIYFHRNAVIGDVDALDLGDEVRFAEELGREGPQATTVTRIGEHGRHAVVAH
jgi:ribosome-associated translation inhibitor RaiA/cold shock CspA family protein